MADDLEHEAEDLSVGDSLREAFAEHRDDTPAPAAPKAEAAPVERKTEPAARADGRDSTGRFAPKAAPEPHPEAQAAPEAARPPASWTAPAKAAFGTLPPEIQAEIGRRERDIEQGFAQQQARLEVANKFDAVIAPFKDRFAAEGIEPIVGVQRLFAAQSYLEKSPVEGLLFLARSYGVHPNQLAQAAAGRQQPGAQPQAQQHPALQALHSELQAVKSQLSQRTQAEQTQRLDQVRASIQAFAADPANIYFDNVRDHMVALLAGNLAKDLPDAYAQAVWANPETRQLSQAAQSKKAEADRIAAQRASATEARRAAGSVVGSPNPGSRPAAADTSRNSVRDDLTEAFRSARA